MFEKEAQEYKLKTQKAYQEASNNGYMPSLYANIDKLWQDGAEYGYEKANEWHDLRKDPNYLPNNARFVLVALKLDAIDPKLGYCTTVGQIQDNKKFTCEGPRDKAIAWRELPTFED